MSLIHQAREAVESLTGMWSPDADEGALRAAACAWHTFADDIDNVTAATNPAARSLIEHNRGDSIDAFDTFWRRYYDNGHGWLKDLTDAAHSMAKALDQYADAVHQANQRIDHELEIQAAVLVAGVGLAVFTFGASAAAAEAAALAIAEIAAELGVAVTTEIATIAATTLTGVAFGGIESITVDLAVAQPLHIAAGMQKGLNLDEAKDALTIGAITGGLLGGTGATAAAIKNAGGIRNILDGVLPEASGSTPRLGQTGGSIRPRDDGSVRSWMRAEEWATDAYDSIRTADDVPPMARQLSEAPRLNGSRGFSAAELGAIKQHIFVEEHPLESVDGGIVHARYDPNADMAEAWIRLRSGRQTDADLLLLEHELAEHRYYVDHPGATYVEAHAEATKVADWNTHREPPMGENYKSPWK